MICVFIYLCIYIRGLCICINRALHNMNSAENEENHNRSLIFVQQLIINSYEKQLAVYKKIVHSALNESTCRLSADKFKEFVSRPSNWGLIYVEDRRHEMMHIIGKDITSIHKEGKLWIIDVSKEDVIETHKFKYLEDVECLVSYPSNSVVKILESFIGRKINFIDIKKSIEIDDLAWSDVSRSNFVFAEVEEEDSFELESESE